MKSFEIKLHSNHLGEHSYFSATGAKPITTNILKRIFTTFGNDITVCFHATAEGIQIVGDAFFDDFHIGNLKPCYPTPEKVKHLQSMFLE